MRKFYVIVLLVLITQSGLFAMDKKFQKAYDLFYNYQFEEAEDYFIKQVESTDDPFPFYAFYSYSLVRSQLANAEYETAIANADKVIAEYRPIFESYLKEHPQDADARFFYTVLLAGKMRIYLKEILYKEIIKEAPKILSNKVRIDRHSDGKFYEMSFGTGSFDYYLAVIGENFGFGGMFNNTKSNGISDLLEAYENATYTKWEAAIVLMYVYLYDIRNYSECEEYFNDFLRKYPKNLEVLAIAAECSFYQSKWRKGDIYLKQITKLLNQDLLRNDRGWRARLKYLEGVKSMLKDENIKALTYLNEAYELDAFEYSWHRTMILKYIGDVYLNMGDVNTAKRYYERVVNSKDICPHIDETKALLRSFD
ncbi:MAG: tetratricopeptide repeat protein [Candidatus Neomarinimicrobiota bacterium]